MKRYSIISIFKWTNSDKIIISSDDFQFILSRYNFILKHIKYIKKLSPNTAKHRISNYQTFKKIYKELHITDSLYPHHFLEPNLIALRDNQTNLIISPWRFHVLVSGCGSYDTIPYLKEQNEVSKILSAIWQDYTKVYEFKYFKIH